MRIFKKIMKYLLAVFMIGGGINHFLNTDFYLRIMPPYLPWHLELVYISGVIEVLLGAMLLVPRGERLAAWGLIALLIAVFPANIHVAMNTHIFPNVPPLAHYLRLPLQFVLIAWAYWFTRPPAESHARRANG